MAKNTQRTIKRNTQNQQEHTQESSLILLLEKLNGRQALDGKNMEYTIANIRQSSRKSSKKRVVYDAVYLETGKTTVYEISTLAGHKILSLTSQ